MTESTETTPSAVAATSTQGGDVRARWAWTEPTVWTERMLTALEQGVKGGKWYSLIDKVWRPANLEAAWRTVRDRVVQAALRAVRTHQLQLPAGTGVQGRTA